MDRRSFLRTSAVLSAGVAAIAAGLAPLRQLGKFTSVDEFLQKYYKELTPEEMKAVLARIEDEVQRQYGIRPHVRDYKPMNGVEYVYALNLTRCVGCRKCVHACVAENNQSRNPEIQYIRVLQMPNDGTFDVDKGDQHYAPKSVPQAGSFYMPVQCHQCRNPPCVKVCPVKATWQEPDGITVIDYNWCIGCRYCEAACPYWARRFNFTEPSVPKEQLNLNMSYLGNRPRHKGVMEKCHFCIQRTRAGRYPACVEVCPTGSRKFGNVLDPSSEVSYILKNKRVLVLKAELGTLPRFFYYFDAQEAPMRSYLRFLRRCAGVALVGDWRYYAWIGALGLLCVVGLNAYAKQFVAGLEITGMSDQVSWGVYIANFTFLVGMAAAAVMLVIPVYIYKNEDLHDLVIFGELLAVSAILMCLAFVCVDLGRPDRFWHLIPFIGIFHFPGSMLSWDVLVLNGYLVLNIYICGYLLYCRYQNRKPAKWFYIPFVFVAIFWAISIHTVTAFLYVGLGGRPFWDSSIVGPRFLASAFTAGPAFIILALQVVRRSTASPSGSDGRPPEGAAASPGRMSRRVATLADMDLLAVHLRELGSVSVEERMACLAGATVLYAEAGEMLLQQGAIENEAFFVLKGRVVVRREEGGRSRTTRNIGPGEQFGEVSAITGTPRAATATAAVPSVALCLPAESLRRLMRNPKMNEIITWRMNERLMITDRSLLILRGIVQVSMIINMFLLANELFSEFYNTSWKDISWRYLVLGLKGYHALVPWFWTAVALNLVAMAILMLPLSRRLRWLNAACVLCIFGIWIEKGMGLVIPGFIPTPLGEMVEYVPTWNETLICVGIWAFGLLSFTLFLRMSVPILQGELSKGSET